MIEFGEQLRKAREEKGLTQQDLAEQLFVTRQSISRWERGDRYPDLITTKNISQILEVSLDDLLSGKEMTKVAEKNPVVEDKTVNNITIALYASVVIAFFIKAIEMLTSFFIQAFKFLTEAKTMSFFYGYNDQRIILLKSVIYISVFLYGLYHGIKDSLSPKKVGVVLIGYFAVLFFLNGMVMLRVWGVQFTYACKETLAGDPDAMHLLRNIVIRFMQTIIPGGFGARASYFCFVRGNNSKLWVNIITIVSTIGIITNLICTYIDIISAKYFYTQGSLVKTTARETAADFVLGIAVYALIIYQTKNLYRKRIAAMNLNCEKELA